MLGWRIWGALPAATAATAILPVDASSPFLVVLWGTTAAWTGTLAWKEAWAHDRRRRCRRAFGPERALLEAEARGIVEGWPSLSGATIGLRLSADHAPHAWARPIGCARRSVGVWDVLDSATRASIQSLDDHHRTLVARMAQRYPGHAPRTLEVERSFGEQGGLEGLEERRYRAMGAALETVLDSATMAVRIRELTGGYDVLFLREPEHFPDKEERRAAVHAALRDVDVRMREEVGGLAHRILPPLLAHWP